MSNYFEFIFNFLSSIIDGPWLIIKGIGQGILALFNIPKFIDLIKVHSTTFTTVEWIFAVVSILLVLGIYVLAGYFIVITIKKKLRLKSSVVKNEDLLKEVAILQKQLEKVNSEKEKILAMKVSQLGIPLDEFDKTAIRAEDPDDSAKTVNVAESRFFKLTQVDQKYLNYIAPKYNNSISLPEICETFRNFACSRMNLYYDINIIRLFFAGMGSTKLLILQGISGTGKTSLPYAMGKFLQNDSLVSSVQPSWRDRSELFGFFNEFTKKFNETEVLRKIYEASYTNDINIIILDEMNIARVEYYFAEMLSILEMPNKSEWKIDLLPNSWETDPKHLENGKLTIPPNMWFIGTANNDDSTFAISDKVYDRALPINLDAKGVSFDVPDTPPLLLGYSHLEDLFIQAKKTYPVSAELITKISQLDIYVIEKLRIAFGNRIMKHLKEFVPVYVACGGTEIDGIDYILATKIFRKFESLNLAFIRDELDGLVAYMNKLFGKQNMRESKNYIERLKKMF